MGPLFASVRSALILDWLPTDLRTQHWQGRAQSRRAVELGICCVAILQHVVVFTTADHGADLVRACTPALLMIAPAMSMLQATLILRHQKWYERHRHLIVALMLPLRAFAFCALWPTLVRFRVQYYAAGDTAKQFKYAVIGATALPTLLTHVAAIMPSYGQHVLYHSLGIFALVLLHQPPSVRLLRWEPFFGRAVELHEQLDRSMTSMVGLVTGSFAALEPHRSDCPVLHLSLFCQLAVEWLVMLYVCHAWHAASVSTFLRHLAVSMAESGEYDAAAHDGAAASGSGGATAAAAGSTSAACAQQPAAGGTGSGTLSASARTARSANGQGGAVGGSGVQRGAAAAAGPAACGVEEVLQPVVARWARALGPRCPRASPQELQRLAQHMLTCLHRPYGEAPLLVRWCLAAAVHAMRLALLLPMVWLVAGILTTLVQRLGAYGHVGWALDLCLPAYAADLPV